MTRTRVPVGRYSAAVLVAPGPVKGRGEVGDREGTCWRS